MSSKKQQKSTKPNSTHTESANTDETKKQSYTDKKGSKIEQIFSDRSGFIFFPSKEKLFKKLFWIISAILLFALPYLSQDYGITGDELVHKTNGENVLKYLKSGGADTTYRHYKNLYLYGGLFDATAAMYYESTQQDPYTVRHIWNALFGVFLVVFTGLLSQYLTRSWLLGLIAMLFTLLSPRLFGDMMNNPKDIPFAMAYIASTYSILRFNSFLPKWDWKSALLVVFSIFISLNIRIGGILLIVYFLAFTFLNILVKSKAFNEIKRSPVVFAGKVFLMSIVSFFIGIIFFPYAHSAPLSNALKALKEMENFQTAIRMLFEGRALWSDEIPWYYIPKWMSIANPLFILVGFVLFFIFIRLLFKYIKNIDLLFLIFVGVFPVLYAIYKHSALYDGIRHFLFVMPIIIVLALLGWTALYKKFETGPIKWVSLGILGILMCLPLRFMIANHPNEYVYFNELEGGIKNANGEYETDYWMNSIKPLATWLIENEPKIKKGDTVRVLTNSVDPAIHYFAKYPNIRLKYASFKDRYKFPGDYYISIPRFVDKDLVLNGAWPIDQVVKTIDVDGVPIGAISTYRDTFTLAGLNASKRGDYISAKNYFRLASQNNPKNEIAIIELANILVNMDSIPQADEIIKKGLALAPEHIDLLLINGVLNLKQNKVSEAYALFDQVIALNYRSVMAYYYKAMIFDGQKNYSQALDEINKAIQQAPNFKNAYLLGAQILQHAGDQAGAQRYQQMAQQL